MRDDKGFDSWATEYDTSVSQTDTKDAYPFAGYNKLLRFVYEEIKKGHSKTVLDIGLGTGNIAKKLYDESYTVYGIDFSQSMIDIAQKKMPNSNLLKWDFSKGLPYKYEKFDYIISTYAFHHLTDDQKISLINGLKNYLNESGQIIIGDISFPNNEELNGCKKSYLEDWDEDEFYFVYKSIKDRLEYKNVAYTQISFCAGVYIIS